MASSSSPRKSVQAELTDIPYSRKCLCIVLRDTPRAFEISVAEMSYDKMYSNCSRGITNLGHDFLLQLGLEKLVEKYSCYSLTTKRYNVSRLPQEFVLTSTFPASFSEPLQLGLKKLVEKYSCCILTTCHVFQKNLF